MNQGMSTFLIANEFMPIIRAVMTAIAIGLFPVFCLLLPTPAFSKALSTMVGFFVFLAAWGVIDCMIHSYAVTMGIRYFEQVAMNHTGYAGMMLTPDAAGKALGVFGVMRTASITLATFVAGVIGFSSGAVMSGLMGQAMAPIHQGANQAANLNTTEGMGKAQGELEQAWTSTTVANHGLHLDERVMGNYANRTEGQASGLDKSQHMGATVEQAQENAQIQRETHAAEKRAAESNGATLPGAKADLADHNLDQNIKTLDGAEKEAAKHGYQNAAAANASLATDEKAEALLRQKEEEKLASRLGVGDRAELNVGNQLHEKEKAFGGRQADHKMAAMLGLGSQAQLSEWRSQGGVLDQKMAENLQKNQGMDWASAGMALSDVKLDEAGKMHTAHVHDQVNKDNLGHYRELSYNNARAAGRSVEEAKAQEEFIQPGMVVDAQIGADGQGNWDANRSFKAHDTFAASETTSTKHIDQNLNERTNKTVIEDGVHADLYQAALRGDDKALRQVASALWDGDQIDRGALTAVTNNMVDQIEKSYNMGQGSSKAVGGSVYGQAEASLGFEVFKTGGTATAGARAHASYDRTATDHNDVLRNQIQAKAAELAEKYPNKTEFNEKFADWAKGTAQHYQERGIERGGQNGYENLKQDLRESRDDLDLGAKERVQERLEPGSNSDSYPGNTPTNQLIRALRDKD